MQLLPKAVRAAAPSLDLHAYRSDSQDEEAIVQQAEASREPESPEQSQRAGERERYRVLYRSTAMHFIVTSGKKPLRPEMSSPEPAHSHSPSHMQPARRDLLSLVDRTLGWLQERNPDLFACSSDGRRSLPEGEEFKSFKDELVRQSYDFYAELEQQHWMPFDKGQQLALLNELEGLGGEGRCVISAQGAPHDDDRIHRMSPVQAYLTDEQGALGSNFYVKPGSEGRKPHRPTAAFARLSLCVDPAHVGAITRQLVDLYQEYPDWIHQMKVMAPADQGMRCDSIVLNLSYPDAGAAQQLADGLQRRIEPAAAFRPLSPPGMHPCQPGISYGELTLVSRKSSFGLDRCEVVVNVVIDILRTGRAAEEALDASLQRFGYSRKNPALIDRTGMME